MAHTGKKMIFRLIQFFNFLFLLPGNLVFLFVNPVQKQKQNACERSHHNNRSRRIKKGVPLRILRNILRKIIGNVIAKQRLRRAHQKKRGFPPARQRNVNINKTKHKPFRHPAVKASHRKKTYRKKR